ncbi:MAG: hypothetical protein ACXIUM_02095 [Wenzhouxiangella sp.]
MRKFFSANVIVIVSALATIFLLAGPLAAKPNAHPVLGQLELSQDQQQQIANLQSAFRAQVGDLDWSLVDGVHPPETVQQWRELRIALRAEIREVLTEEQRQIADAMRAGVCPHSGKATPARVQQPSTTTLFL